MNFDQALQILDQATSMVVANRKDHELIVQALQFLKANQPKPKEEQPE